MAGGTGEVVTTSVAGSLTAEPAPLLTTTVYVPASPSWTLGMRTDGPVAPAISDPFFNHRYEKGALPTAATINSTGPPTRIVCDSGCIVMTGGARLTSTVTTSLMTLPTGLVAVKAYLPESATRTLLSVSV